MLLAFALNLPSAFAAEPPAQVILEVVDTMAGQASELAVGSGFCSAAILELGDVDARSGGKAGALGRWRGSAFADALVKASGGRFPLVDWSMMEKIPLEHEFNLSGRAD